MEKIEKEGQLKYKNCVREIKTRNNNKMKFTRLYLKKISFKSLKTTYYKLIEFL